MSIFRALSAPVVVVLDGEKIVLPKLKMKHIGEIGMVISKLDEADIKTRLAKEPDMLARMLAAAKADAIAINIDSVIQRASTEHGARAILEVTEREMRAQGRSLLPAGLIQGSAEAKGDTAVLMMPDGSEDAAKDATRAEAIKKETDRLGALSDIELVFSELDLELLCNMAYSVVTPNQIKVEKKENPPVAEAVEAAPA